MPHQNKIRFAEDLCAFCNDRATHLCDYPIGSPVFRNIETPYFTCDAPMCERHRVQIAHGHVCKRGPGGSCEMFTTDHCPYCYENRPRTFSMRMVERMSPDKAEYLRRIAKSSANAMSWEDWQRPNTRG